MNPRQSTPVHRHVVTTVAMRLLVSHGEFAKVTTELRYSTRDPYAVQATFTRPNHAPVVWVFARDLLMTGVARHNGTGDVRIYPDGSDVIFELSSPQGAARLAAEAGDVRSFVSRMLSLVAPGEEAALVNIDAELARLDPSIFANGDA